MEGWLYRVRSALTWARPFCTTFLPPTCFTCGSLHVVWGEPFCVTCYQEMADPWRRCPICGEKIGMGNGPRHRCEECLRGHSPMLATLVAGPYDTLLRDMIHRFKFSHAYHYDEPLAWLLARAWADDPLHQRPDMLIAVPLHPQRQRQRGYNQSALLARCLARHLGSTCRNDLLCRVRITRPQQELDKEKRRENIAGAFAVSERGGGMVTGKRLLLVDDVMTTGATVRECCRVLLAAGAVEVRVAVVARA